MMPLQNIRLLLAFDGTAYHGWQVQKDLPTVQGTLLKAIAGVTGEEVNLVGSGRTDAGTHARGLVASFRTSSPIAPPSLARALNTVLPRDIRVLSARKVPVDFHAQRSACSKLYRYQIYRGPVMPPHMAREHFHLTLPLEAERMKRAAVLFEGKHDFASFAATASVRAMGLNAANGTVRTIFHSRLMCSGHRMILNVEGDGFLHHMVRNMVGTLIEVGRGRITLKTLRSLLHSRDRRRAGFTAPAHGLILMRVRYRPLHPA